MIRRINWWLHDVRWYCRDVVAFYGLARRRGLGRVASVSTALANAWTCPF